MKKTAPYEMVARQTGRTSRMIRTAVEYAKLGRMVYILCPAESKETTQNLAREILGKMGMPLDMIGESIKFETMTSIGLSRVDWRNQKLFNAHPNCKLLIDHFVYEREFKHILDGFHQYDE